MQPVFNTFSFRYLYQTAVTSLALSPGSSNCDENDQLRSFNISFHETFTGRVGSADTEALYTSMGVFLKNTYSYSDLKIFKKK